MGAFVKELFSLSSYKQSQGRMARQATFGALAVIVVLAAWSLHNYFIVMDFGRSADATGAPPAAATSDETTSGGTDSAPATKEENQVARNIYVYGLPLVLLVGGLWVSYRSVQLPAFADFLISVEGEMNKVSWPARGELLRASVVVMFVIFFLAFILFAYDYALVWIMKVIEWSLDKVGGWFG